MRVGRSPAAWPHPDASRLNTAAVAAALVLVLAIESDAKPCGDDVGGARVACPCGDTVVSDTALQPTDPVVAARCRNDGLTIRANELAETITLDLHGLAIVGSGVGHGISVVAGGSDGAVIRGGTREQPGEVVAFGTGMDVHTATAVKRIEALRLSGHRHEGLALRTAGTMVFDVSADHNGGDGIRVFGQGGRMLGVEASDNAGAGIRIDSHYTVLEARVERNRKNGIVLRGSRNDLSRSVASANKGFGIVAGGADEVLDAVVTEGNTVGGVTAARDAASRRPQH